MSDVCINGRINNDYRYGTKRYNPNTATEVWHRDNGKCWDDFNFFGITIYRKRTGEPFIVIRQQVWTTDKYEGSYGYVDDLIYTKDYDEYCVGNWKQLIEQYIPEDIRKMYID